MDSIISELPPIFAMVCILIYFVMADRRSSRAESDHHRETYDAILDIKESIGGHELSLSELKKRVEICERELSELKACLKSLEK